jgi:hypothetical protein
MPKFTQASFAKGEISTKLFGRIDAQMYQEAAETLRNIVVHSFGGASNRPGLGQVAPIKDHTDGNTILRRFQFSTEDQYLLIFGNLYMWVIRADGLVVTNSDNIEGITAADPAVVTMTGHTFTNGQAVFVSGITEGPTEINGLICKAANVAANTIELTRQDDDTNVDTTAMDAWVSGGTVAEIYELTTPYATADLKDLVFTQANDVVTITHPDYQARDLTRIANDNWTLTAVTFAPDQAAPTNPVITVNVAATTTVDYAVTAINEDTQEESLALEDQTTTSTAPGAGLDNTYSWDGAAGAARYSVYRKQNGLFGFIGQTEDTSFRDQDITPDLTLSPPTARDPLSAASAYPAASGYFEQRQVYGGSDDKPDTNFFSKPGNRRNMTISFPLQANDAITATLAGEEINSIKHYVTLEDLIVFTAFQEWRISAGSDVGFSFDTIRQKPQTGHGIDYIAPEVAGRTILFVGKGRARVFAIKFDFNTGIAGGYDSQDLNELADHLFAEDGPATYLATDMCYVQFPEPRCYVVRSDGKVCAMTFNEKAGIVAWSVWDTKGEFERCEVLKRQVSDVEDGVYFLVKRTYGTKVVRNVEKLHTRKFADILDSKFLDASLIFDQPITISNVSFASGVIVITTASAHNLTDGDTVYLRDIIWETIIDADTGTEVQPDQLNGRVYTIQSVTPTTFQLQCPDGGAQ